MGPGMAAGGRRLFRCSSVRAMLFVGVLSLLGVAGSLSMPSALAQTKEASVQQVDWLLAHNFKSEALQQARELVNTAKRGQVPTSARALALVKLYQACHANGQLDEAEKTLRLVIEEAESEGVMPDKTLAVIHGGLGELLEQRGRPTQALASFERARALLGEPLNAVEFQQLAKLEFGSGRTLQATGADDLAEPLLHSARDLYAVYQNSESIQVTRILQSLARAARQRGDVNAAMAQLQQASDMARRTPGDGQFQVDILAELASLQGQVGDLAAARQTLTYALTLGNATHEAIVLRRAVLLLALAQVNVDAGNGREGLEAARQAFAIREQHMPGQAEILDALDKTIALEKRYGSPREVDALEARARTLRAAMSRASSDPLQIWPVTLRPQPPVYPRLANGKRQQGRVIVKVNVDEQGHVRQALVRESAGDAQLDEAARVALLGTAFEPARSRSGQAISATVAVPIAFRLGTANDLRQADAAPTADDYPQRVARLVRNLVDPAAAPLATANVVTLTLKLAPDGQLLSYNLYASSGDPMWDQATLRAASRLQRVPVDANGLAPTSLLIPVRP